MAKLDPQFLQICAILSQTLETPGGAQEKSFDMAEEFADIDFHSVRLEDRFVRTMEAAGCINLGSKRRPG